MERRYLYASFNFTPEERAENDRIALESLKQAGRDITDNEPDPVERPNTPGNQ